MINQIAVCQKNVDFKYVCTFRRQDLTVRRDHALIHINVCEWTLILRWCESCCVCISVYSSCIDVWWACLCVCVSNNNNNVYNLTEWVSDVSRFNIQIIRTNTLIYFVRTKCYVYHQNVSLSHAHAHTNKCDVWTACYTVRRMWFRKEPVFCVCLSSIYMQWFCRFNGIHTHMHGTNTRTNILQ